MPGTQAHDGPKNAKALTLTFDGRKVPFPSGVTVHRAAELNGIYIPSLCSHKDLSPFGGCRLCMVEIEGMRGYPLSCTTSAEEGMSVRTDTPALREFRKEMLKLILSEHPSSCLICDERSACKGFQGTIRKAGVTTGCRFCPNDDQCELQDVIDKIGLPEMDYPILYHGFEPEHDDPFYDRDYNICILCGRCVRMCKEVRGTSVLAFTERGSKTKIGPAFGRSHRQAGCEFCGACVDVCPTGALADKASKWEGKPDGRLVSTCPFCGVGCQVEFQHKNGRLTKVKAYQDPEVNDGQLCVRGRFCLPEATHHFSRVKKPMLMKEGFFREVSWEEALGRVSAELKGFGPDEVAMLVSPDLTNESLFAARKFFRACLGSPNLDTTTRLELPGGPGLWSWLFSLPVSIKDISRSDVILAVGLDSRFDFSVVGTRIRQAIDAGATLVTVDARDGNLARYTDDWLRPAPGREGHVVRLLAAHRSGQALDVAEAAAEAGVDASVLERALAATAGSALLTVVLGPQVLHSGGLRALVDGLKKLAGRGNVNVLPLYYGTNCRGALELGLFAETAPEGLSGGPVRIGLRELLEGSKRPRLLYLVGDNPFFERPDCDILVVQDTYLPSFNVDIFLPASSFAEGGGTLINLEGRVQELAQAENPPEGARTGFVRPDWRIFADLAAALACHAMNYKRPTDVFKDIRKDVPDFPAGANRRPRRMKPLEGGTAEEPVVPAPPDGDFRLVASPAGYRHRGVDLSTKVGGLRELGLEEGFRMNPGDLGALGVSAGDTIVLSSEGRPRARGPVREDDECPKGFIYFTRPVIAGGLESRRGLRSLYAHGDLPRRVEVSKAAQPEATDV